VACSKRLLIISQSTLSQRQDEDRHDKFFYCCNFITLSIMSDLGHLFLKHETSCDNQEGYYYYVRKKSEAVRRPTDGVDTAITTMPTM
jgi:hypothetical protein